MAGEDTPGVAEYAVEEPGAVLGVPYAAAHRPGRGESGVVLRTLRDMVHEARLRMDRDHEQAFEEQALARRGVWFDHQTSTASAATAR